jgi:hypothetical protein
MGGDQGPLIPRAPGNQSRRFTAVKQAGSEKEIQGDISPWSQDSAASEKGRQGAKRPLEGGRRSGFPLQSGRVPLPLRGLSGA